MKEIKLTRGKLALVDDGDYERVSSFKWYALSGKHTFYAARTGRLGESHTHLMHRDILGPGVVSEVDHKNGNGLDNRRDNIRPATDAENSRGFRVKSPKATSRFRGVYFYKRTGKWVARLSTNGECICLGYHHVEEEAARAYDRCAIAVFKEFANLNFP